MSGLRGDGLDQSPFQSPTVDIYIAQAIPYATTKVVNALKLALREDRSGLLVFDHSPLLVDRNTLKDVLDCASSFKRAVRFVRWGVEIDRISFEELVIRNLHSFVSTGRYTPVRVIFDHWVAAESLLDEFGLEMQSDYAHWADFQMDSSGLLTPANLIHNSPLRRSTNRDQSRHPQSGTDNVVNKRYSVWTDEGVVGPIDAKKQSHKKTHEFTARRSSLLPTPVVRSENPIAPITSMTTVFQNMTTPVKKSTTQQVTPLSGSRRDHKQTSPQLTPNSTVPIPTPQKHVSKQQLQRVTADSPSS
eukprot:gene34019-41954_t